jgi:hypothetical protein
MSETEKLLVDIVRRMQIALGEFCCDYQISEDDMEESSPNLLAVCGEAYELLEKLQIEVDA